jgi:ELWxxDGT repeat protein
MKFQVPTLFTLSTLCLFLPALFVLAWVVALLEISGANAAEREDIQLVKKFGEGETVFDAISYHGNVYFFVLGNNGISLWKTGGTGKNTVLVKRIDGESAWAENIITHRNSTSMPREKKGEPILINDNFYFFSRVNASGAEYLWQSDGTPAGTTRVAPLPEFCLGMDNAYLMNGILYFLDSACLWRTDGTGAGTWQVSGEFDRAESPAIYNNHLYFSAFDNVHDQELWIFDGTSGGTKLFADMNVIENSVCLPDDAGTGRIARTLCFSSSFARNYALYNNELYFTAFNPAVGVELLKTNGNGVQVVRNPCQGFSRGHSLCYPFSVRQSCGERQVVF